ncbi:MAG TPA: hydroxylamine reductase, partial [Salinivirgaceae bacterium]|nr:hydroxylamine reductase [Salinivirgaceae bacterium]
MENMFCYQCQEAAKGVGCTIKGVCGKSADVSGRMDLLLHVIKGICIYSTALREQKKYENPNINRFVIDGLFSTITNANFDKSAIERRIQQGLRYRDMLREECKNQSVNVDTSFDGCTWTGTPDQYAIKALTVGILSEKNEDIRSLKELIVYGVKGMAAYAEHAENLGHSSPEVISFMQKALAATTENKSVDELVALTLETGKYGVEVMALLDKANTSAYGNPEITKVNLGVRNNPAILISGHDLKDMEDLLAQTEGTGVDVYTHSEMLPANYYPAFKKYKPFVGNYG